MMTFIDPQVLKEVESVLKIFEGYAVDFVKVYQGRGVTKGGLACSISYYSDHRAVVQFDDEVIDSIILSGNGTPDLTVKSGAKPRQVHDVVTMLDKAMEG